MKKRPNLFEERPYYNNKSFNVTLLLILSLNDLWPKCGGLNENGSHRFIYLNTWFPVGGTGRI